MANIDKALLRKGRLIASYEFKELSHIKTCKLIESLGLKTIPNKEQMTLSDIYNFNGRFDEENLSLQKTIGFK